MKTLKREDIKEIEGVEDLIFIGSEINIFDTFDSFANFAFKSLTLRALCVLAVKELSDG
jgi:hypothetical protein